MRGAAKMNRRVFVTGASAGIGHALAKLLVEKGDTVWGIARRGNDLATLQRELPQGRFFYNECDITNLEQINQTKQLLRENQFVPEVVILNAGTNHSDLIPEYDHQAYNRVFLTNLFGAMVWVEYFLPLFKEERKGQFIAISSMSAFLTHSRGAAYSASKAALTMTFESLQKRYCSEGIFFKTIHLGPVRTAMGPSHFPFLVSDRTAAMKIMRAIEQKKTVVDFPKWIVGIARLSQVVPFGRQLFR